MRKLFTILTLFTASLLNFSTAQVNVEKPTINVNNKESLQNGMKLFMNYCSGCHSLEFQRYNVTGRDLGIDDKIIQENLIFTGSYSTREGEFITTKVGELIHTAMSRKDGAYWFGKAPPDLSTIVRAKGADYIFQYLRSFYIDPNRPMGVNNLTFPDVGMPHVLMELQGEYKPVTKTVTKEDCEEGEDCKVTTIVDTELVKPGAYTPLQYREAVNDITNFLSYVAEPAQIQRAKYGPWVLGFLVIFTLFAYALNREYWKDVK